MERKKEVKKDEWEDGERMKWKKGTEKNGVKIWEQCLFWKFIFKQKM